MLIISQVINVASVSHRVAPRVALEDPAWSKGSPGQWYAAYGQSKLANVQTANELDRRFGTRGLHALSLQPGGVAAETFRDIWSPADIAAAYSSGEGAPFSKSAAQGAATSIWAAFAKEWEGKGGKYLENVSEIGPVEVAPERWGDWWFPGYAPQAYDPEAEKKLWTESCKLLGIEDRQ